MVGKNPFRPCKLTMLHMKAYGLVYDRYTMPEAIGNRFWTESWILRIGRLPIVIQHALWKVGLIKKYVKHIVARQEDTVSSKTCPSSRQRH